MTTLPRRTNADASHLPGGGPARSVARMSMTAFYRLFPHKLLAKKYAAALSELRELGDANSLHHQRQLWVEKEAAYLARIGDLSDDLAEAIECEVV